MPVHHGWSCHAGGDSLWLDSGSVSQEKTHHGPCDRCCCCCMSGCVYDVLNKVWRKCISRHESTFFCFAMVTNEPTWLRQRSNLKYKNICCINNARASTRSLHLEMLVFRLTCIRSWWPFSFLGGSRSLPVLLRRRFTVKQAQWYPLLHYRCQFLFLGWPYGARTCNFLSFRLRTCRTFVLNCLDMAVPSDRKVSVDVIRRVSYDNCACWQKGLWW